MNKKRRTRLGREILEQRVLLAGDLAASLLSHGHDLGDGHDHDGLRYAPSGQAYFFDAAPDLSAAQPLTSDELSLISEPPHGDKEHRGNGPREGLEVPVLHSNPDADKKIYLDFDGEVVSDTSWNFDFNFGDPIHAPAYSLDQDIFSFTDTELAAIEDAWRRVAEDFIPFEVDVTTEDPGTDFFAVGNQGLRVIISTDVDDTRVGGTGNQWYDNAGGVAYFNAWSFTSDTPVWVFENNLGTSSKNIAEAASHEVGHGFGLRHDGDDDLIYFSGQSGWAPIMGVGYDQPTTQWSRGEYTNANNHEDDIAIIQSWLGYQPDEHADDVADFGAASPLTENGSNYVFAEGIIHRSSDVDVFRFETTEWTDISLFANVLDPGANLDVELTLYDSNGVAIASHNPIIRRDAELHIEIGPGSYTVGLDGVGRRNPQQGYSDYGSIGQYKMTGVVGAPLPGDFDLTAGVDAHDIDLLCTAIQAAQYDVNFDLDGNGSIDMLDMDELVFHILDTHYGDANLDRIVDSLDFDIWNTHRFSNVGGWAAGDFSCDGAVDLSDLHLWNENRSGATTVVPSSNSTLSPPPGDRQRAWMGVVAIELDRLNSAMQPATRSLSDWSKSAADADRDLSGSASLRRRAAVVVNVEDVWMHWGRQPGFPT